MRIVAIADTHLFHDRLSAAGIPDGDVLVHAGDLCRHGSLDELARAADFFRALPHPVKVIVAGNHDVCLERTPAEARALLDGFLYLEDASAVIDGKVFYGSPWTVKHRVWAFGAPRGPELAEKWANIPDHVDVLVTHGPPWGFGDRIEWEGKTRHVGCVDLLSRVLRVSPPLHLFGHIHQDPGQWEEGPIHFHNATTGNSDRGATVIESEKRIQPPRAPRAPRRDARRGEKGFEVSPSRRRRKTSDPILLASRLGARGARGGQSLGASV